MAPTFVSATPGVIAVSTPFAIAASGHTTGHPLGSYTDLFIYELADGSIRVEARFCPLNGLCTTKTATTPPESLVHWGPGSASLRATGTSLGDIRLDLWFDWRGNRDPAVAMCPTSWSLGPYQVVGGVTTLDAGMSGALDGKQFTANGNELCALYGADTVLTFVAVV